MRYTVKLILGYTEDIKSTDSLEEAMNIAHEYCRKYEFNEFEYFVRTSVIYNPTDQCAYHCVKQKPEDK